MSKVKAAGIITRILRRSLITCGVFVALVLALCGTQAQAQTTLTCPTVGANNSFNYYVTASGCTTTFPGSGVLVTATVSNSTFSVTFIGTGTTPTSVQTTNQPSTPSSCYTAADAISGNTAYHGYAGNATCNVAITLANGASMALSIDFVNFNENSRSATFTLATPAPTVTSVSPNSGSTAGGTAVTISGTNFTGATSVTFGGTAATSVNVVNATTITATTPAHAAGTVNVVVTTAGGPGTGSGLFTYVVPVPTVTSVSPNSGSTAGGTAVTITGTNFTGATSVTFGGTAATGINVVNATTITATTPAHAAGAVDVTVTTTAGGPGTGTGLFTYAVPSAVVTNVTPNTGTTLGGTAVTITGTNFTGATSVTFGGTAATGIIVVNATTITATTPAHAAGTVDIIVTTSGGPGTGTGLFTYVVTAPTVSALSPSSGPASGGTVVTITGTNLGGATAVRFGGASATTFSVSSATQIVATSPPGALGTVNVTVTTPSGVSAISSANQFSYTVPADSVKLRALQAAVTPVAAQASGVAITSTIDNAISEGFSGGGPLVSPSGSGMRFNFAGDPESEPRATAGRMGRSNDDPFSNAGSAFGRTANSPNSTRPQQADSTTDPFSALAYAGSAKAPPRRLVEPREWLGWAEISGVTLSRWGMPGALAGNTIYGNQVNVLAGLTRRLTPDLLIGAFGGWETFDYRSDALQGRLKGDGGTVGGYFGWRLTQQIRFDAAVGYSVIGFDSSTGTATASFDGTRWLVSSGLTGSYQTYGLMIEPSARVYALWETENRYTDSLGTQQPVRKFSTGRASGGVKLGYPVAWSPTVTLVPNIALYGDYYFNADSAGALAGTLLDGWSARAAGGVTAQFGDGAQVALSSERAGIGSTFSIWTYRARASVPFAAK